MSLRTQYLSRAAAYERHAQDYYRAGAKSSYRIAKDQAARYRSAAHAIPLPTTAQRKSHG